MHGRHRGTLEKRPQDDDFYTFDWSQVHPQPIHDPFLDHLQSIEALEHHQEEVQVPHEILHAKEKAAKAKATDHQEAAPKKKSADKHQQPKPKAAKAPHAAPAPAPAPAPAKPAKKEAPAAAPTKKTTKPQHQHHETQKANDEYESYYNYHPKSGKYEYAPHYETTVYDEDDDDEKHYPVYPYKASIYYDIANGYDIVYDPDYESPFDTTHYDKMFLEQEDGFDDDS